MTRHNRSFTCFAVLAGLLQSTDRLSAGRQSLEEFLDEMNQPARPVHVIGNIYYVGTNGVTSHLITTPEGHFLIDTGFNQSVPLIAANVRELGFTLQDIKFLLSSHAHFDHVGGLAEMQRLTGATIVATAPDAGTIAAGEPKYKWPGAKVDRIIEEGDRLTLGGTTLVAHLTPGHTPGCTTWTMTVAEGGKNYDVVFSGGFGINPGVKLVGNREFMTFLSSLSPFFTQAPPTVTVCGPYCTPVRRPGSWPCSGHWSFSLATRRPS